MNKFLPLILYAILVCILPACGQPNELSQSDIDLINELNFKKELIAEIRKMTASEFVKATGNPNESINFRDSSNYVKFRKKGLVGLKFSDTENQAFKIVSTLKESFKEEGYFIYISQENYGFDPDVVCVLKTEDKFDLIRFEGCNGVNFDIYVEDVAKQLSKWDKDFGLEFIGIGYDFVDGNYVNSPKNMEKHAKELYEFCPDIVDQGVGSVAELEREITQSKKFFLWWD